MKAKNESNQKRSVKRSHLITFFAGILIIILLNVIGNFIFTRFDLTSENRYTLSKSTKKLLKGIDDIVYFKVYLEGDFPSDFKRLRSETKEMLNQFRAYNKNIEYEFFNINDIPRDEQEEFYKKMLSKGFQPTQLSSKSDDGKMTEQVIFPCAEVMYKGREADVMLLQSQRYVSPENMLNSSIESLEYVLSDAIRKLTITHRDKIGFVQGQGEMIGPELYDILLSLSEYYTVDSVNINEQLTSLAYIQKDSKDTNKIIYLNRFEALVIARPLSTFSDKDLFLIDQHVMRGGKILWLIDPLNVTMDSLQFQASTIAMKMPLNLDNMLFRYGVRINPNLVQDINCVPIPMKTSSIGEKPVINFVPWYYFPEIHSASNHPIVKNLNALKSEFISSIDTLDVPVKKTILLTTSKFSRTLNAPVEVSLDDAFREPDQRLFNKSFVPVAVLLEGSFESAFKNRLPPQLTNAPEIAFSGQSKPTKMIVVADGDMIKNQFNRRDGNYYPLGYDQYTKTMYGNKEFILNCLNYLCDDEDFMSTRAREIKIRKLDPMKIKTSATKYKLINLLLPIVLVGAFGGALYVVRKRRYTKF